VCEGCGDCGVQSNCLSVLPKETEFGRKRMIDQSACNKDFSCLKGFCPSFVTVEGGRLHRSRAAEGAVGLPELPDPVLPALDTPWNTVITGIGGTGVLTVSAILGMAAHLEGKGCTVLNLSGLAQKFGPVVSHVRVGARQQDIHAVRVAAGDADLLLGCDLVVSAAEDPLAKVDIDRSHAIVNSFEAPTAAFTRDPDARFPTEAMKAKIREEVGEAKTCFVDATAIATALLGDAIAANLFLLGFAWQRGLVPVGADAIGQAIVLNGVSVRFNQEAFLWGRRAAHDIDAVLRVAGVEPPRGAVEPSVDALVARRAAFLADYQDAAWAEHYKAAVSRVRAAEMALGAAGQGLSLTRTVARALFKLMSYKDEYEVARLYTDGRFLQSLGQQFEGDYRLKFHLAPPLFSERDPVTGHLRKREYGSWMLRAFGLLARLRRLRGTRLDPFGWTEERRSERQQIADYEALLARLLPRLDARTLPLLVEIAGLPLSVRGFGHVKERNLHRALARQEELLARLDNAPEIVRVQVA
ncbi:MAG: DUF6537 domain-containing protein, partial [Gammaproteobacteria bacterium]